MRYAGRTVVDDLSLAASRAAITVVLGPNGAGQDDHDRDGRGLPHAARGARSGSWASTRAGIGRLLAPRVGVMLQSGGVWPSLRAADMLTHVSRLYAHPLPTTALMERLGLTHVARTPYRRLSGGEQQKLALACALVGRPEVAFLDEPTTGLDPESRIGVWQFLAELRDSGVGIVMSTHLLDEAQSLADHVIVIDQGRLAAAGSVAELTGTSPGLRFRSRAGMDVADLTRRLPDGFTALESTPGQYRVDGPVTPQVVALGDVVVRRPGGDARGAQHRRRVAVRGLLRDHLTGGPGRRRRPQAATPRDGQAQRMSTPDAQVTLDLTPAPGAAPRGARWWAQSRLEWRQLMTNGEQLLLTLIIPIAALVGVTRLGPGHDRRGDTRASWPWRSCPRPSPRPRSRPGFERRSGVLKFLGSHAPGPLRAAGRQDDRHLRRDRRAARADQRGGPGARAGRHRWTSPVALVVATVILGTVALGSWGFALAGLLRAEATLAVANGIFLLLLFAGGTVLPTDRLPEAMAGVVQFLPSAALGDALRTLLGAPIGRVRASRRRPWWCSLVWAVAGIARVHRGRSAGSSRSGLSRRGAPSRTTPRTPGPSGGTCRIAHSPGDAGRGANYA